jgi:hypothetical protein
LKRLNFIQINSEGKQDRLERNVPGFFNMGHRMGLYVNEEIAEDIISISKSFSMGAKNYWKS